MVQLEESARSRQLVAAGAKKQWVWVIVRYHTRATAQIWYDLRAGANWISKKDIEQLRQGQQQTNIVVKSDLDRGTNQRRVIDASTTYISTYSNWLD